MIKESCLVKRKNYTLSDSIQSLKAFLAEFLVYCSEVIAQGLCGNRAMLWFLESLV